MLFTRSLRRYGLLPSRKSRCGGLCSTKGLWKEARGYQTEAQTQGEKGFRSESIVAVAGVIISAVVTWNVAKMSHQTDQEKRASQINATKALLKDKLEKTAEIFKGDELYPPFLLETPLEQSIRCEIVKPIREPGVVVVLCPKDAGKTTRMARVLRTMKEGGNIFGAFSIDSGILDSTEPVMQALNSSVGAPPIGCNFWDLLPAEKNPIILVIDDVDSRTLSRNEEEKNRAISRLRDLSQALAMASVAPQRKVNFQTYVLTSSVEVARELLTINGGRKVRLIAYQTELVGGDPLANEGNWARKGLKFGEEHITKLVNDFPLGDNKLDEATKKMLIELGVQGGTPGLIRTVLSKFKETYSNPVSRMKYLETHTASTAKKQEKEWLQCAEVKRPDEDVSE